MKKGFYIGQPLIIKDTGERVNFAYESNSIYPCNIFGKMDEDDLLITYYKYEEVEPSTEFKFSEIIAGLEQGYFEVGTKFSRLSTNSSELTVKESCSGLYLQGGRELPSLTSLYINSTWHLVEPRKEMTLEEIEAELGYKIKLKNYV